MVCGPCKTTAPKTGIDYEDFDEMVSPVDNFYNFAIGGWRAKNPIPPEYPSWNCFTILHDMNQKRLKEMVNELLWCATTQRCINTPLRDAARMARGEANKLAVLVFHLDKSIKIMRAWAAKSDYKNTPMDLFRGINKRQMFQGFPSEGGTELAVISSTAQPWVAKHAAVQLKYTAS